MAKNYESENKTAKMQQTDLMKVRKILRIARTLTQKTAESTDPAPFLKIF